MPESKAPNAPNTNDDEEDFNEDQELIIETLPILEKIHAHLASGLSRTAGSIEINDKVKAIFDGAIYAHDQTRTQDWKNLENQLEELAGNAILTLILLRRRHRKAGMPEGPAL
ncbi:MAG: hypothetical protein ACOH12_03260 [Parvibaculaceae bacterium]